MNRRDFLRNTSMGLAAFGVNRLTGVAMATPEDSAQHNPRPNILFITADDMSYDSLGCTGCTLPHISPHLDNLASEGVLFNHCHVPTPICGPARAAWITGTWPQRSGHMGHYNQPPKWFGPSPVTTTVPELLRTRAGYYTGVICKSPDTRGWDYEKGPVDTGLGRDPSKYYESTKEFIQTAVDQRQPFFLHTNSQDPHEYWAGQEYETKAWIDAMMGTKEYEVYPNGKPYPEPQVTYTPNQIPVPPCWPDNMEIRENIHTYFNSVRRLDETVGEILRALAESGQEGNTMVVFLSDNGIGRAFGKWSLYPIGTRTPMIVRWPGVVEAGRHDTESVFSAIDTAPTFLKAAGVDVPDFMDARSVLDIVRDPARQGERALTFSSFDYMNNYPKKDELFPSYTRDLADKHDNYRPMRAIHSTKHTYIWNGWANGKNEIPLEMSSSQMMRGLLQKTGHAGRADFETFRTREEFYDTASHPGCLVNLISEPVHTDTLPLFRNELLAVMKKTGDQETHNYEAHLLALKGNPAGQAS